MKFLLIARQKKNVDTFETTIDRLLAGGHGVTLALQERLEAAASGALAARFPQPGFALVTTPDARGDAWRSGAPLVRVTRDWAQYLRPPYRHASKLRGRAIHRLAKEAGLPMSGGADLRFDEPYAARIEGTLAQVEASMPSDPLHEEFIRRHVPDVVLVTPGIHFGSAQADFIKSARACGIPAWMLLFSWDNLSTKGALHVAPDLMFVWNERQRREAADLHNFPIDRAVAVGAPRFDGFFALRSVMSTAEFLAPLGLDAAAPTLLYVCSSRFIAADELTFLRRWLAVIRSSDDPALRRCNVIVRPHPDQVLVEGDDAVAVKWRSLPQATGWVQRPFGDSTAVVLRTTYSTPQAFFECIHHAFAVVGLNTSAELEAGIVGRPVFTVLADGVEADGQAHTLHFNYLLREQGGFVTYAPDMSTHVTQLSNALRHPDDSAGIQKFIGAFLRPCGAEPVADVLARTLLEHAANAQKREATAVAMPGHAGIPAAVDAAVAAPDGSEDEPRQTKTLVLGYRGSTACVLATEDTRRTRRSGVLLLDEATVRWLDEEVHPGDVVYDIGAGIGAYSLTAALHRGALVVAFEPGFSTFRHLCDNLLRNGCYRSIVPLPVALGDHPGVQDLEYLGDAGGHQHALTGRRWRARADALEARYTQPVCAERLDDFVARHQLPSPNAIRLAVRGGAGAVLEGASGVLQRADLRSILVTVGSEREADRVARAAGEAFTAEYSKGRGHDARVRLQRKPAAAGFRGAMRLWQRVTGAAGR